MSILIKGIEMPKSCSRCFCMASCRLWKNIMHPEFNRHRNCPLVPVPPHGRCVDADAVAKMVLDSVNQEDAQGFMFTKIICQILKDAPTIIPAEEVTK